MKKDDILETARKRMDAAVDYEQKHRLRAAEDMDFIIGDGQWPASEREARDREGRPCLTFNQMPQFVRRVNAQIRGMNPAIRVRPADDEADKDVAEIIEGLVREIEYDSGAQAIYEGAGESAAICSMGAFRVVSQYEDGPTFAQKLVIKPIYNPFAVFWDPNAKDPTRQDASWCFIIDEVPLEAFKKEYPDAKADDFTAEHRPSWISPAWWNSEKGAVVVAEYYWIEMTDEKIGMTMSGQVIKDWPKEFKPARVRTMKVPRVKWAKLSGCEVLEGPVDVPGKFIPVIAVMGEELFLGEESYRSSVIRFAKDAQVSYNLAMTAATEVVMTQPKAPYMVTGEQIAGYEDFWNSANVTNRPYLPYNSDPNAPSPQRVPPPIASQGLTVLAQMAGEDMKRTTGIFDASLGARSNETSGVAINARQQEAEAANSIYADHLVRSVMHCGRIIVGQIPHFYDTHRTIRILGQDAEAKLVKINAIQVENGQAKPVNDLTVGQYDVHISVGPSYDSKRKEASQAMLELSRNVPAVAQIGADLIIRGMDIPDGDRLADRLKKTLPPGIAEEPEEMTPEQQQQAQQAQAQAQEVQQMQKASALVEMKKLGAEAKKAEGDARRANAEADKAEAEAMLLKLQIKATADGAKALQTNAALADGRIAAAIDAGVSQALAPQ